MDHFLEQLVAPKSNTLYKIANIGYVVLIVLGLFYAILAPLICLFMVSLGGVLFFAKRYLYVEYEYIFTNGDVDIDVIYQQNSRKKKVQFQVKEVMLFAPCDSQQYKDFANKPQKVINVVPKGNTDRVYSAIVSQGANKVEIRMVPSREFMEESYRYNPRLVVKY